MAKWWRRCTCPTDIDGDCPRHGAFVCVHCGRSPFEWPRVFDDAFLAEHLCPVADACLYVRRTDPAFKLLRYYATCPDRGPA